MESLPLGVNRVLIWMHVMYNISMLAELKRKIDAFQSNIGVYSGRLKSGFVYALVIDYFASPRAENKYCFEEIEFLMEVAPQLYRNSEDKIGKQRMTRLLDIASGMLDHRFEEAKNGGDLRIAEVVAMYECGRLYHELYSEEKKAKKAFEAIVGLEHAVVVPPDGRLPILSKPVSVLTPEFKKHGALGTWISNVIDNASCYIMADVVEKNESQWRRRRNCGEKGLRLLCEALAPMGLTLGMDVQITPERPFDRGGSFVKWLSCYSAARARLGLAPRVINELPKSELPQKAKDLLGELRLIRAVVAAGAGWESKIGANERVHVGKMLGCNSSSEVLPVARRYLQNASDILSGRMGS